MMPPHQEGHSCKTPEWPGLKAGGKLDFLRALQTKHLSPEQSSGSYFVRVLDTKERDWEASGTCLCLSPNVSS